MNWYQDATCRDQEPELFFPIGVSGAALLQLQEAKAVCAGCPVRCLCLEWAVLAGIDHGVWGGTSEEERRTIKRRTARHRPRTLEPTQR